MIREHTFIKIPKIPTHVSEFGYEIVSRNNCAFSLAREKLFSLTSARLGAFEYSVASDARSKHARYHAVLCRIIAFIATLYRIVCVHERAHPLP